MIPTLHQLSAVGPAALRPYVTVGQRLTGAQRALQRLSWEELSRVLGKSPATLSLWDPEKIERDKSSRRCPSARLAPSELRVLLEAVKRHL